MLEAYWYIFYHTRGKVPSELLPFDITLNLDITLIEPLILKLILFGWLMAFSFSALKIFSFVFCLFRFRT